MPGSTGGFRDSDDYIGGISYSGRWIIKKPESTKYKKGSWRIMEIVPGIHQIDGVNGNCFIIVRNGLTLIDTEECPETAQK